MDLAHCYQQAVCSTGYSSRAAGSHSSYHQVGVGTPTPYIKRCAVNASYSNSVADRMHVAQTATECIRAQNRLAGLALRQRGIGALTPWSEAEVCVANITLSVGFDSDQTTVDNFEKMRTLPRAQSSLCTSGPSCSDQSGALPHTSCCSNCRFIHSLCEASDSMNDLSCRSLSKATTSCGQPGGSISCTPCASLARLMCATHCFE